MTHEGNKVGEPLGIICRTQFENVKFTFVVFILHHELFSIGDWVAFDEVLKLRELQLWSGVMGGDGWTYMLALIRKNEVSQSWWCGEWMKWKSYRHNYFVLHHCHLWLTLGVIFEDRLRQESWVGEIQTVLWVWSLRDLEKIFLLKNRPGRSLVSIHKSNVRDRRITINIFVRSVQYFLPHHIEKGLTYNIQSFDIKTER